MKNYLQLFLIASLFLGLSSCSNNSLKYKSPDEKKGDIYFGQGTDQLVRKEYTKGLKNLLEAEKLIPNNSQLLNNIGLAYYLKEDISKAKIYFEKSISKDQKNVDAKNNLASIYYLNEDLNKAEKIYLEIEKDLTYEQQHKTYYNLALIALKKNSTNKAISLLEKSLIVRKSYCPSHYQLGLIYNKNNNHSQALEKFKDAQMGVCVNNPAPHFMQGQIYSNLQDTAKALEKFNHVIQNFSDSNYSSLAIKEIKKLESSTKNLIHTKKVEEIDLNDPIKF